MTHPPPSLDFEIAALRDRNAALEDALNGKLGDLLPELRAEIERLREELHYCKGVCDLAMKHRDIAEAEVKRLQEELRHYKGVCDLSR